ncbi:MAG: hypothetical protein WCV00_16840 [Verrucomicrobiia bacterium]
MKQPLIILSLLLPLESSSSAAGAEPDLGLSDVSLQLSFVTTNEKSDPDRVSVSITNTSHRSGKFRLPSPFVAAAADQDGYVPYTPSLALRVKELKTGMDASFVFTKLRKPSGPGELIFLKPGEVRSFEFPLMLFYRWGPCNPAESFKECFKPGDVMLEVRAEVFVIKKSGSRRTVSNAQTLRCSFPEWLFKGSKDEKQSGLVTGAHVLPTEGTADSLSSGYSLNWSAESELLRFRACPANSGSLHSSTDNALCGVYRRLDERVGLVAVYLFPDHTYSIAVFSDAGPDKVATSGRWKFENEKVELVETYRSHQATAMVGLDKKLQRFSSFSFFLLRGSRKEILIPTEFLVNRPKDKLISPSECWSRWRYYLDWDAVQKRLKDVEK